MDWPGAGAAYPAMKTAIAGPPGTRAAFVTRSYPGLQWTDTIINEGVEPLVIDGRTYRTLKMAHEREGIEGNIYHSIITVWRDIATGVNLKVVETQISGQSYGPGTTWTATRVEPVLDAVLASAAIRPAPTGRAPAARQRQYSPPRTCVKAGKPARWRLSAARGW